MEQQRRYLLGITTKSQGITTIGVEAQYGCHQFLKDDENLRLAMLIVDSNPAFSEDIERRGHAVDFSEIKCLPNKSPRKLNRYGLAS